LNGGLIIDPSQKINKMGLVAISNGKIVAIGNDISEVKARKVFDLDGKTIKKLDNHKIPEVIY